jgi:hypothetical protein
VSARRGVPEASYDEDFHRRHIEGCGSATWLSEFLAQGVQDVQGVDGSLPRELLQVPSHLVQEADLTRPLDMGRQFDWVICLEVGEHLIPAMHPILIENLCRHGSLIAFSAAVPHQGGTGHVGERWPSYWAGMFAHYNYRAYDLVRAHVWNHPEVELWYQQNLIIYARDGDAAATADIQRFQATHPSPGILDLMHPGMYERWTYRTAHGIPET